MANKRLTEEEKRFIEEHAMDMNSRQIGECIGRCTDTVYQYMVRKGIKHRLFIGDIGRHSYEEKVSDWRGKIESTLYMPSKKAGEFLGVSKRTIIDYRLKYFGVSEVLRHWLTDYEKENIKGLIGVCSNGEIAKGLGLNYYSVKRFVDSLK